MDINWDEDYKKDFTCYKCEKDKLRLNGLAQGKQQFKCLQCQSCLQLSIDLSRRSWYVKSRWKEDYQGEFVCPECHSLGITVKGFYHKRKKRVFKCPHCRKLQQESCDVNYEPIEDSTNEGVIWYRNHRIDGFVCPECNAKQMYFGSFSKNNKKGFYCRSCRVTQRESIELTYGYLRYTNKERQIQLFNWEDDRWDLRTINPNYNLTNRQRYFAYFPEIKQDWLKEKAKQYVEHLCKIEKSLTTISHTLTALRSLSHYLQTTCITDFHQINRSVILDYLSLEKNATTKNLSRLRDFFFVGTLKDWFEIDQDIIRDEDYPKAHRGNPDPLSDKVREQIEQNLHLLPDPIARMYLISYFSAMRPSELALLTQDCLIQEGQYWKLRWKRKKNNDYHFIPITRAIAKVIQEQLDYIQNLWGNEWNYLFCHYRGFSSTEVSQPYLEPVKKVITSAENPLRKSIRTLIKVLNIRDENGKLAKYTNKMLRPTRLTNLFEQGHDLAVVSAWAGHKHFATTSAYYTKVSCELIDKEAGHIQKALVNAEGKNVPYESLPKSFWENPTAHKLELSGTQINTPIYGFCGLDLDQECHKFLACYTCNNFVATHYKLPQYIKVRDELRGKESTALANGQDVLVEQFGSQAAQLDLIIQSLGEVV